MAEDPRATLHARPGWGLPCLTAGAALLLSGCAASPSPMLLVAAPGPNKTAQAFAQDDDACRTATTGAPTPERYLQCMAGRGNLVTSTSPAPAAVTYIAYPTAFSWPSFDWDWGSVTPAAAPAAGAGPSAGPSSGPAPGGHPGGD